MWALLNSDNTINEIIPRPKQLTIGDTQYPRNIFSIYTTSKLEAIRIYEIVVDDTNLKDPEYYINTNQSFAYASGVVTATYGTATAKAIDNILYTAEDESADASHVEGEIKTTGFRKNHISSINLQAGSLLQATDWYTLRAASGGTAIPSSVSTYQAGVRTKANAMCTLITNAANVNALAALYVYNDASPSVRPLGEFPTL